MDWNETKSILLEVEKLFSRDDDLRDVEDIIKMQNEIDFHYANSLKDAKDIIKGDILVITLFRPFFNLELLYF